MLASIQQDRPRTSADILALRLPQYQLELVGSVSSMEYRKAMAKINTSSDHKDLPLELLAAVLQHLRQKDRLAASALVNKTWREAANMATTELSCFTAQKDFDSLLMWLKANKHASRIREIFVGDGMDSRVVFNLPADILVNLESLEIYPVCNLVVTSGATHHTEPSAAALPIAATSNTAATTAIITTAMSVEPCIVSISAFKALRKLELDMTHLDLSDLGRCTALQSLWLYLVNHLEPVSSPQAAEPLLTASCAAPISGLPALLASDEEEVTDSADSERYAAGGSTFKSSLDELDLLWHQEAGAGPEHEEEKVRYLPPQLVTALPQLNQLTSLSLHYSSCLRGEQYPAQPVTASLSSLQRLQGLEIDVEDFQGLDLTYLPINLTSLVMKGCYGSPSAVTLEAMPGLQYLVKLQQLSFSSASRLDAVLLSSLIQLTALHLSGCSFRSTMAVQQLMSGLQHLDKLKVLDLRSSLRQHAVAPEIYSAISASSELQRLNIDRCVFTPGAVEHIFPGAAILNSINELTAPADLFDDPGSLARMSASCPTLRRLEMNTSSEFCGSAWLGDWQGLSTLTGLTDLTSLQFNDVTVPDDALQSIAACSQLKRLKVVNTGPLALEGKNLECIMQLTQLTGLEALSFYGGSKHAGSRRCQRYHLVSRDSSRHPDVPHVYQQLERLVNGWEV